MGTYFEDSEERQRKLGRDVGFKLSDAEMNSVRSGYDDPQPEYDQWDSAIQNQEAQEQQNRNSMFAQKLAGYEQIENDANMAREAYRQDQGVAVYAMMNSIRKRGKDMDPALCPSISQAFGMNVTGAFLIDKGPMAGTVVIGTPQKDANGNVTNGIGMMLSPEQRYRIFDRMKAGDLTRQYMAADYAMIKQSSGLTEDQLADAGIRNPNGPYVQAAINMPGGGAKAAPVSMRMRPATGNSSDQGPVIPQEGGWEATSDEMAKPGPRPRHGGISVFSTNGSNYRIGTADEGFKRQDFSGDHPANNRQEHWKLMSVGPSSTFNGKDDQTQVRVYENSKTGERVSVKDGETPPWQRGAGYDKMMMERQKAADREKLKQMDLDAREKRMNAYNDERKKLREQNAKFRKLEVLRKQLEKELSPEGKKKIQGQMDEIMKSIGDEVQDSDTVLGNNSSGKPTDAAGTLRRQQLGGKPSQGQSESQEKSVRPFKNISEEKYAQLSEEDKKKCKRVAKGRGYVMYLDNPNGSTNGTQDNKPYPETLKGVDDDWDFSNEERDDFNRLAKKYPNEFTNSEEPTNEAYRELYERLKKKEEESRRRKENAQKISSSNGGKDVGGGRKVIGSTGKDNTTAGNVQGTADAVEKLNPTAEVKKRTENAETEQSSDSPMYTESLSDIPRGEIPGAIIVKGSRKVWNALKNEQLRQANEEAGAAKSTAESMRKTGKSVKEYLEETPNEGKERSRVQRMNDAAAAANDENSIYNIHERMTKDGNDYGDYRDDTTLADIQKRIDAEEADKSERMRKAGDAALAKRPSFSQRLEELRKLNVPVRKDTTLADIQKRIDAEEDAKRKKSERMRKAGDAALAKRPSFSQRLEELRKLNVPVRKDTTLVDIQKRIDAEEDAKRKKKIEEAFNALMSIVLPPVSKRK